MFRSDQELRSVCLIAVTAYSDDKHRTMTRQAGFSAHLKKPIEEAALRSAIVECELKRATN
jgi:CheY-like chemotaxis protein